MRNGALLLVIAGAAVLNGLSMSAIPMWRQALFPILAVAAYLHGRHLSAARDPLLLAVAALPAAGYATVDMWTGVDALLMLGIAVTLPWLAGRFRRQQADLVAAAAERVTHLEREREFIADRARLLERSRLAADMHDALGHDLALIALRAGALELTPALPPSVRTAAAELRTSAVTATDRLRHTVRRLSTTPAPGAADEPFPHDRPGRPGDTPGDWSLDALIERARAAGMTVRLDRAAGGGPDPAPIARAVHRVVREALTNAARHAPGSGVDIRLDRTGGTLTVLVRNPLAGPPRTTTPGTGLAGLRECVGALGGTLRAEAVAGTFTVTACLPVPVVSA